jgi:hypothetical protein
VPFLPSLRLIVGEIARKSAEQEKQNGFEYFLLSSCVMELPPEVLGPLFMRGSDASRRCSGLRFLMATKVWLHVLACAAGSDVVRFGMTCQAASLLATDASLWRTLCLRQKQHQRYAPPAEALPPTEI